MHAFTFFTVAALACTLGSISTLAKPHVCPDEDICYPVKNGYLDFPKTYINVETPSIVLMGGAVDKNIAAISFWMPDVSPAADYHAKEGESIYFPNKDQELHSNSPKIMIVAYLCIKANGCNNWYEKPDIFLEKAAHRNGYGDEKKANSYNDMYKNIIHISVPSVTDISKLVLLGESYYYVSNDCKESCDSQFVYSFRKDMATNAAQISVVKSMYYNKKYDVIGYINFAFVNKEYTNKAIDNINTFINNHFVEYK